MTRSPPSESELRRRYQAWVEDQIEDYKASLTRDELMEIADQALLRLEHSPDGQYPLTELLLCNAVDTLLFERLSLPTYRQWRRACQNDTTVRPIEGTDTDDQVPVGSA